MLDLDRFKPINDNYGHEAGDFVLQKIAKRIVHLARTNDHCARYGGDEFIIIMENIGTGDTLAPILARIDQAICSPLTIATARRVLNSSQTGSCAS